MRIGLIGPQQSVSKLTKIAMEAQILVELVPLVYSTFKEALTIIVAEEQNLDALLFTGQTPYRYASNFLIPKIPWDYVPRNDTAFIYGLLQASAKYQNKINNISVDSFDESVLDDLKNELSATDLSLNLINYNFDILAEDYLKQILVYHSNNYFAGKADLCITGIEWIRKRLQAQNIPVVKVNPNIKAFLEKLNLLCTKHKNTREEKDICAVIAVYINFFDDYSFYSQNELFNIKNSSKVMEAIYYYAQRLGAAVFTISINKYYLVTSANNLFLETNNLTHIDILDSILGSNYLAKASIGIGFSDNTINAKIFADRTLKQALQKTGSYCYAMDDSKYLKGPIMMTSAKSTDKIDQNLLHIAEKTSLGLATIQKLIAILTYHNLSTTTPSELAYHFDVSLRQINRILEKLEAGGYVNNIGKQTSGGAGRPSRIISFNFPN